MKVALDIKNMQKLKTPSENDVIVYDGEKWYVTTKDDILKETNALLDEANGTLTAMRKENAEFMESMEKRHSEFVQQTNKEVAELAKLAKDLLSLNNEQ